MRRNKAIEFLKNLLYPADLSCYLCEKELPGGEKSDKHLCQACLDSIAMIDIPIDADDTIVHAACLYEETVREIVLSEKDSGKPYLCHVMAAFLLDVVGKIGDFDVLFYVPDYKKRRFFRGYDHMKRVADLLAEACKKPVGTGLIRIKESADQTTLSKEERMQNVKDNFAYAGEDLTGKRVLLVDDVVTTGATLKACTEALLTKNPADILYATFAVSPILYGESKKKQEKRENR